MAMGSKCRSLEATNKVRFIATPGRFVAVKSRGDSHLPRVPSDCLECCPQSNDVEGLSQRVDCGLALGPRPWPSPQKFTIYPVVVMAQRASSYFHLHLVSDATAQYTKVSAVEHVYPLVRTQKQLDRVLAEIEESPGIVLYTLLDDELLQRLENHCRELSLPCLSILGPVLQLL